MSKEVKRKNIWILYIDNLGGSNALCPACKEVFPTKWMVDPPFMFCPYCGVQKYSIEDNRQGVSLYETLQRELQTTNNAEKCLT